MMEKFLLFFYLFLCISCSGSYVLSYQVPKFDGVDEEELSLVNCDYIDDDHSCFVYVQESFEIEKLSSGMNIVFIMDVSKSMEDNLEKIGQSFSSLIYYIQDFDWQMAFTTADHGDHDYLFNPQTKEKFFFSPDRWQDYKGKRPAFGRFMPLQFGDHILSKKVLNSNYANYVQIFHDTITLDYKDPSQKELDCNKPPYCQEGLEQPLRVLKSVISQASSTHRHFLKKDSVFVAIVVTDEKEREEDSNQATTAQEVIKEFSKVFGSMKEKRFITYSVSIQDENCLNEQSEKGSAGYSKELDKLVDLTGGLKINICEKDYSPMFSLVSEQIKKSIYEISLDSRMFVSEDTPVKVIAKDKLGRGIHLQWEVNEKGKAIFFPQSVKPGTHIEVVYFIKQENPTDST